MMSRSRLPLVLLAAGSLLVGCSSSVRVTSAPMAKDKLCSQVLGALSVTDNLAGAKRREVTGQSAAAWGDPAVVMRCGVEPPGPTTQGCLRVNGVDWIGPHDPADNNRTYISYGRSPAVEVHVPVGSPIAIETALTAISAAIAELPVSRQCI